MATSADYLAAARGHQVDGNWASVASAYQQAIDALDPTVGEAINAPKRTALQAAIADAVLRSRGYVASPGMTAPSHALSIGTAALTSAIRATGTGASTDSGQLTSA